MKRITTLFILVLALGCGDSRPSKTEGSGGSQAGAAGGNAGAGGASAGVGGDAAGGAGGQGGRAEQACTYAPGTETDAGASQQLCTQTGCPEGQVCVVETGGPGGDGGGASCHPIPLSCHGKATCDCMATCVCTSSPGFTGTCSEKGDRIECGNGTI